EKCSFDDTGYRRESGTKHAQRLFKDKFLVDHWSDEKFKEKCKKASESRAHQKMSHYNETKSFARLRQEIEQREQFLNDKTDEQVFEGVLGKDTHGYLRAYNRKQEKILKMLEWKLKKAKKRRNDVDRKIEQKIAIWEKKFHQLMNFIKGVLIQTMMIQEKKAHHDELST
ncbi:Sensor histidine kinase DpiB, partial [Bienertia sinuspersici]